jgi:hypothetical protein
MLKWRNMRSESRKYESEMADSRYRENGREDSKKAQQQWATRIGRQTGCCSANLGFGVAARRVFAVEEHTRAWWSHESVDDSVS